MSEHNGEAARHARPEKHSIANEPEWVVSMSEAKELAERIRLKRRRALVDSCEDELREHSWRLWAMGRNRRDFALCFVLAAEANNGMAPTEEEFREECRRYGISPALIWLLVSIAFSILKYFWENRND